MQETSVRKVISLSLAQIENHDMDVEDDDEVVMTTLVSSIPNIQSFSSMLGSSSYHHCFLEVNLSSIMGATISMSTISVDSPIHSSRSSFSSAQPITTSPVSYIFQDDIPSLCMTLPQKEDFPIYDSFTSLTFTSVSSRMDILPLSIDIPLNQTQTDPLVSIYQQSISSSEFMAYFGEDAVVSFGKYY